jgi:hypothetical protein
MHEALDTPEDGGKGMQRVIWASPPDNTQSHRTANRLGFKCGEDL